MIARTLVATLAALLVSSSALAATLTERSPFTQGHWWDPSRSGAGFELFNVGAESMAIWYTFEESGRAVWYTAQGELGSRWPLLKHRWADGRHAGSTQVGTFRLDLRSRESADVVFDFGPGRAGVQRIEPFVTAVGNNEVDHSGSYFNPDNSGWGFTLTQQGEVLGGVLYTYEPDGTPMWYAGFDRGVTTSSVGVIRAAGACPHCTYRTNTTESAGRIGFEFRSERDFVMRNQVTFPMAAGVSAEGARVAQLGRTASVRLADRTPVPFGTEALLTEYLRAGLAQIYPFPTASGVDFSPPPAGSGTATFSPTNLQEAGVDEADVLKTDGRFVYAFAHSGSGARLPGIRIAEVSDQGAAMAAGATFALGFGATQPVGVAGMYLAGDRLATVTGTQPLIPINFAAWAPSAGWTQGTTHVEIFDITNRGAPVSRYRVALDGHPITSRRIGDRLYVVSRFVPFVQGYVYGSTNPATLAANQALLANTPLNALLPQSRTPTDFGGAPMDVQPLVSAQTTYALPLMSRMATSDMVIVTTIDLVAGRSVQAMALAGAIDSVYASTNGLYLTSSNVGIRQPSGALLSFVPQLVSTQVHQLNFVPGGLQVVGSGTAEGFLSASLDEAAFRMSEHRGRMRLVTGLTGGGQNRNLLTTLEPSTVTPGMLRTVSVLPNAQRPQGLGLPLETLRSTRFLGDRLYAVTFGPAFQGAPFVDPLYVVDLSNAADPRITGELVIPGFSRYLHPVTSGLMLGLGYEVSSQNIITGLQVALYDVSDDGRPREMQRIVMGSTLSDSALFNDHHAFSALLDANGNGTFALPARLTTSSGGSRFDPFPHLESGLMKFSITGIGQAARMTQLPGLITLRAPNGPPVAPLDPAVAPNSSRSVLFPQGTVYFTRGVFSHQDAQGNARIGF